MEVNISDQYHVEIRGLSDEDGGGYLATFRELGQMITGLGETREEAIEDLESSLPTLADSMKSAGESFPEPLTLPSWDSFSGRVTLRMPKMLHYQLFRQAESEGVSFNSYLNTVLQAGATAWAIGEHLIENKPARLASKEEHVKKEASQNREVKQNNPYWLGKFQEMNNLQLPKGWKIA